MFRSKLGGSFGNPQTRMWGVIFCLAASVSWASLALPQNSVSAQQRAPARAAADRRLPEHVERMVRDADADAQQVLNEMEKRYRAFLGHCRSREKLKPFVAQLLGWIEKFQVTKDAINNEASQKRIRALLRECVLDDEDFVKKASSFAATYSKFLADQDARILIALKVDGEIPAKHFAGSNFDLGQFRLEIAAAVDASVAAAQTDVGRFVANTVLADVLAQVGTEIGKGFGLVPEDNNSLESQVVRLMLDLAIGAALDQVTDPTDELVRKLSDRLAAAEAAILQGTAQKPGLFRSLRQLTSERNAARRAVLGAHFSK